MRTLPRIAGLFVWLFSGALVLAAEHPVYPPTASADDVASMSAEVAPLMALSIDEVTSQVPRMAGFHWVGCPNCDGGIQENALDWHFGMGDTVRCRYCGMTYPNEKFPMNKEVRIVAPNGDVQIYRYHENAQGRQYFLESNAWFERMLWIRASAVRLATLFHYTGDQAYADRAAAIMARFAQVVPNYAVRYDFPFQRKRFYPADQRWPYEGIPAYRGCKFTRWAVSDIPEDLARAWDLLEGRYDYGRLGKRFGPDPDGLIQKDLLRYMVEFTTANPENQGNMSPGMYRMMLVTGRVLSEPNYVHDAVNRFNNFIRDRYFADGWWMEGTSGYHSQTVNGLRQIAEMAQGYSDPPDWKGEGERFDNLNLLRDNTRFNRARQVTQQAILPNGHALPINDTYGWASRSWSTTTSQTILWPGLGQALLGAGTGENQVSLGMNWSGNYGFHNHMDNGSIILYAFGRELLPDIGYTHTRWHNWIINSASHNMVVVDERSQTMKGPEGKTTQGNLRWFDAGDKHVQVMDLDAQPAYAEMKTYRRRLALVHAAEGFDYVIDRFDLDGGKIHDMFIHGSADESGQMDASLPIAKDVKTLVPSWGGRGKYHGEGDRDFAGKKYHVYDLLTEIRSAPAAGMWTATWRYKDTALRAHMVAPKGSTLYRYLSPMIRPARNNDADLPKYMTPGIMERHAGSKSEFITVYEPFRKDPWIESVKSQGGKITVTYTLPGGRQVTDRIDLGDDSLKINSSAGWSYDMGRPVGGKVLAFETTPGKWALKLDRAAPKTGAVRVNFGPRRSFVFPVSKTEGDRLELAVDTGIEMDSPEAAHFVTFPHDKLSGAITWTIYQQEK